MIVGENEKSWDSKIKHALWVDQIAKKLAIGKIPFELVSRVEVQFPIHSKIPVYKVLL